MLVACVSLGRHGFPGDQIFRQACVHVQYLLKKTQEMSDNATLVQFCLQHLLVYMLEIAKHKLGLTIKHVVLVTDGCSKQFKCKFNLDYFSSPDFLNGVNKANNEANNEANENKIQSFSHQYHQSMNGKGSADASAGWTKMLLISAEKRENARLPTAWHCFLFLAAMAAEQLDPVPLGNEEVKAFHTVNKRAFFFVAQNGTQEEVKKYAGYTDLHEKLVIFAPPTSSRQENGLIALLKMQTVHEILYFPQKPGMCWHRELKCNCENCINRDWDHCANILNRDDSEYDGHQFMKHQIRPYQSNNTGDVDTAELAKPPQLLHRIDKDKSDADARREQEAEAKHAAYMAAREAAREAAAIAEYARQQEQKTAAEAECARQQEQKAAAAAAKHEDRKRKREDAERMNSEELLLNSKCTDSNREQRMLARQI